MESGKLKIPVLLLDQNHNVYRQSDIHAKFVLRLFRFENFVFMVLPTPWVQGI
jgi:hypothetical protein